MERVLILKECADNNAHVPIDDEGFKGLYRYSDMLA